MCRKPILAENVTEPSHEPRYLDLTLKTIRLSKLHGLFCWIFFVSRMENQSQDVLPCELLEDRGKKLCSQGKDGIHFLEQICSVYTHHALLIILRGIN